MATKLWTCPAQRPEEGADNLKNMPTVGTLRRVRGCYGCDDARSNDIARCHAEGDSLQDLYLASYDRLVGTVGAICGDRHEAEEAVQEAFVRLMSNWAKVSRYDSPEAWVRAVAVRQVSSRRRKTINGLRAALRHGPPPDVPEPTPTTVDAERALAALPPQQRAVVVLHRLGLDTEATARALGVPAGTVKSRLARARNALSPLLREDLFDA